MEVKSESHSSLNTMQDFIARILRLCGRAGIVLSCLLFLAACTNFSAEHRRATAERMATAADWSRLALPGQRFAMIAYVPRSSPKSELLTVYIEGDGLAWESPSRPSDDPTPVRPVALEMALAHPNRSAAYLSRPCQYRYTPQAACEHSLWTSARYGMPVVEDMNSAVEQLKTRTGARRLVLVGHSGGGVIAALLAARRDDVALVVTAASNLDTAAWTRSRGLQPLAGSLNPADDWERLRVVPQMHFVGAKDTVVRLRDLRAYQSRFPESEKPPVREIADYSHACCWAVQWAERMVPLLPQ